MTALPAHLEPVARQDPSARRERVAPLLDVDPDLGQLLEDGRSDDARRQLLVRLRRIPSGPWNADALTVPSAGHLGLLVLDGVVMREMLTSDVAATELIGPGDILRPWHLGEASPLIQAQVRWSVLAEVRVAVLDPRVAQQLGNYPEVMSLVVERMNDRSQRLAVSQAISQLNRVDERLRMLFWHLAERWGRVSPAGVLLPMTLSHRLLAQLVGARRPTVSTALGHLAETGEAVRRQDGTWLLGGAPPGQPDAKLTRFVPPRRRFMAHGAPGHASDAEGALLERVR
jgi:hypothetical protein